MLDKIRGMAMRVAGDPIGFFKNWWVTVIAAMVLGDSIRINSKISEFLDRVSGGRF